MRTHRWLLIPAAIAAAALATEGDPRGWSDGPEAANTARVLGPVAPEPVTLQMPKAVMKAVTDRPTLVIYLSPTCPHCKAAAPELAALARRIADRADVVAFSITGASAAAVAAFKLDYDIPFPILPDTDGLVGAAMQVTGTPSAMLVRESGRDTVELIDLFYPYLGGSDTLVEMRLPPPGGGAPNPFAAFRPGEYHGNTTCGACHQVEYESWMLTHHSIAWSTLDAQQATGDPECVRCHVTGFGEPTGWEQGAEVLEDVGCEACHGPGGPHDGARADAREACAGCHDAKHSIDFSVAKGLPHLDHFVAHGLDEAAFQERREALLEGRAGKPLLAFGDRETVGSAACASCHPEATAHWKAGPHAAAMASLAPHHGTDNVACVACHATDRRTGPGDRALADYRTEEGVGCEACHGPGSDHVKAGGGTENIIGLGESCPVCVIESVCTGCHDRRWDPLWDLDRRLPAVRHHP
jgi:thiol-disulfide isomerase/thioredoxin